MNQTSTLSFVVPVLPATGIAAGTARRAGPPVPRSAASRIMSRMMNATRGSITAVGTDGPRWYTTWPAGSSIRVTSRGSTTLPPLAHIAYAAT